METILVNFSEIKNVQYFTSYAEVPLNVLIQENTKIYEATVPGVE